jgi:hypothetical protein
VTLTEPAPTETSPGEAEALFKEARRRRHCRWAIGILALLVFSLGLSFLLRANSGTPSVQSPPHVGLPRWTPPSGAARSVPAIYVAGDGKGGVGVYSTSEGSLIRTLSPQAPGGPDGQIVLSADRRSVFFAQPTGTCSGNVLRGPVSGISSPTVVVSVPQTLALSPSPNPTSSELAWVGVTCGSTGSTASSTLYVTNLRTGARNDLGPFTGQNSDNEIAWSPDGNELAAESSNTVTVFDVRGGLFTKSDVLTVANNCRLVSPAFLSERSGLAVIRTCYAEGSANRGSQAVAFNATTGKPVGLIASAPEGGTFQGLSVDASGQNILLGVVSSSVSGAELVRVDGRRLVAVSQNALTDAEW